MTEILILFVARQPKAVFDLFRLPSTFYPELAEHGWGILGNSFGLRLVRRILGPPREVPGANGRTAIFDPAWCAEGIIHYVFRAIPELRTVVLALRPTTITERIDVHPN